MRRYALCRVCGPAPASFRWPLLSIGSRNLLCLSSDLCNLKSRRVCARPEGPTELAHIASYGNHADANNTPPHHLHAMHQQLPQVALFHRRHPDARKAPRQQQLQNVPGVPRVGLSPAHVTWLASSTTEHGERLALAIPPKGSTSLQVLCASTVR